MKRTWRVTLVWTAALLFALATAPTLVAGPLEGKAAVARKGKKKGKKKATKKAIDMAKVEAKRLFKEGNLLFDSGQFDKALEAYTAAYAKQPAPEILVNIAQCHRNLGNYEESIFFYKKYLNEVPDSPFVDSITEILEEMEKKAEEAREAAAKRVAAEKAAAEAITEVERKKRASLEAMRAAEAANAARLEATAEETRLKAIRASKPFYQRAWFWTVVGGALLAGGGVAVGVTAYSNRIDDGSLGRSDFRGGSL